MFDNHFSGEPRVQRRLCGFRNSPASLMMMVDHPPSGSSLTSPGLKASPATVSGSPAPRSSFTPIPSKERDIQTDDEMEEFELQAFTPSMFAAPGGKHAKKSTTGHGVVEATEYDDDDDNEQSDGFPDGLTNPSSSTRFVLRRRMTQCSGCGPDSPASSLLPPPSMMCNSLLSPSSRLHVQQQQTPEGDMSPRTMAAAAAAAAGGVSSSSPPRFRSVSYEDEDEEECDEEEAPQTYEAHRRQRPLQQVCDGTVVADLEDLEEELLVDDWQQQQQQEQQDPSPCVILHPHRATANMAAEDEDEDEEALTAVGRNDTQCGSGDLHQEAARRQSFSVVSMTDNNEDDF